MFALTFTIPYTPRWLVRQGRKKEALETLAWIRKLPEDSEIVQLDYIEIQAEAMFGKPRIFCLDPNLHQLIEAETTAEKFPHLTGLDEKTRFRLQVTQFGELFTTRSMFHRTSGK